MSDFYRAWTVVHRENGAPEDEIDAAVLGFDEPVDLDQAVADAEYTYGDDFGSVLAVRPGDDPDAALDEYRNILLTAAENDGPAA